MATGDWFPRNRSQSADIDLESADTSRSSSSSSGFTSRSSLPTFAITPPVSPTRVKGQPSYPNTHSTAITTLSKKYGSLDRRSHQAAINNGSITKVYISLSQYKIGTPSNPCSLQALGIVPKRHSVTERSPFATLRPNRLKSILPVTVRGVVPSSPVALTGQLHPGDQIVMVNGQMVNLKNIDSILLPITTEIIMDVINYTSELPPDHPFSPPPNLSSAYEETPPPVQSATPPLVLLLTLDTKEDDPAEADILYRYPFNDGGIPLLTKLINLRGVVATVCDINSNQFETKESCCSVVVDDRLFYAFSTKYDNRDIFMILIQANRASPSRLSLIYQIILDSFNTLFGSLKSGLLSHDHDSTHLLSAIFHSMCPALSSPDIDGVCPISTPLTPAPLQIPIRTKGLISAQLNQLDSGVIWSDSHSTSPNSIPIGSCVFYKGYLIVSHLSSSFLRSAMTVCLINDLFELTINNTATQTIIWRQVHQTTPTSIPGYSTYVAIMAMEQTIICHVGDYHLPHTVSAPPSIRQSLRLIMEDLHGNGLLSECEGCVLSQTPVLTTADVLLAGLVTSSISSRKKTHVKRNSAGSIRSLSISTANGGSESDSNSDGSGTGVGYFSPQKKKSSSIRTMLSTSLRKSKSTHTFRERQSSPVTWCKPPYMLVAGTENLLLYFTAMDIGRGVVIRPCKEQIGLQPVQKDLLKSFKLVAGSIHQTLHRKYSSHRDDETDSEKSSVDEATTDKERPFMSSGSPVREHGVLMECTIPSDVTFSAPKLHYWVIGRLFVDEGIELYICYQESMSQVPVEMMFKLIFGTAPS